MPSALFALKRSTVPSVDLREELVVDVGQLRRHRAGRRDADRSRRAAAAAVSSTAMSPVLRDVEGADLALAAEHAHDRRRRPTGTRARWLLPPSSSRKRSLAAVGRELRATTRCDRAPASGSSARRPPPGRARRCWSRTQMSFGSPPVQVGDRLAVGAERRRAVAARRRRQPARASRRRAAR